MQHGAYRANWFGLVFLLSYEVLAPFVAYATLISPVFGATSDWMEKYGAPLRPLLIQAPYADERCGREEWYVGEIRVGRKCLLFFVRHWCATLISPYPTLPYLPTYPPTLPYF